MVCSVNTSAVTAKQSRLTAVPDGPPGELERRSALGSLEAVEDLTGSGANDVFSLRVGRSTLVLLGPPRPRDRHFDRAEQRVNIVTAEGLR
jgi:hypothetical protein